MPLFDVPGPGTSQHQLQKVNICILYGSLKGSGASDVPFFGLFHQRCIPNQCNRHPGGVMGSYDSPSPGHMGRIHYNCGASFSMPSTG